MHRDVKTVEPLIGLSHLCRGQRTVARVFFYLRPYLDQGVFRELREVRYFNRVGSASVAATWPHGQDIARETQLFEMVAAASSVVAESAGANLAS